jgi:hypothetical protein
MLGQGEIDSEILVKREGVSEALTEKQSLVE